MGRAPRPLTCPDYVKRVKTELSFSDNILEVAMKNQTTKKLLLSLMLCNLGFAAVGLRSPANPPQGEIPAKKPTQPGSGHAPHPFQGEIPAKKQPQLGSGHAPQQPLSKIEVHR